MLKINDAREIGDREGYKAIVVIGVRPNGYVDSVSWGKTRNLCQKIGEWLDWLVDYSFKHNNLGELIQRS